MSYVVIKVYSFECDAPGCNETAEIGAESTLRVAEGVLRRTENWTAPLSGGHFCPKHHAHRLPGTR